MKRYEDFEDELEFRAYLRSEGYGRQKDYFMEVYNKRDLYTGEIIPFENKAQYLSQNFINRSNLNKWLMNNPEEGEVYLINKIKERKELKGLQYALSACDLRSLKDFPVLPAVIKAKINWIKINEDLGLKIKYHYRDIVFNHADSLDIFIDTREQKPLKFEKSSVLKLAYGDYALKNGLGLVFAERKSIQDLWGTLGNGFDRFKEELSRAENDGVYIVVVVDYPVYKATSYNHNKRFSKCSPEFIFSRLRELNQTFNNVQFVFSGSREKSSHLIEFIFSNEKNVKNWDLQYMLDAKIIKI